MITSRSFLFKRGNVSGKKKSFRENQNTHFIFSNFLYTMDTFMVKGGKIR
jgi:hypothetical protein